MMILWTNDPLIKREKCQVGLTSLVTCRFGCQNPVVDCASPCWGNSGVG
jgi:hypothetical protein